MKNKLLTIAITVLTTGALFAENPKPTRTQTATGEFTLTTITKKQKFYTKATALVANNANTNTQVPGPVSTSLPGNWNTTEEAAAAFNQQYNQGATRVVSAISYELGPDQTTSGPTNSYQVKSERSQPKTQSKITASGQSNPAWTFTSWIGKSPPECEITGDSSTTSPMVGNVTTITTITNYTWTSNWNETQK